MTVVTLQKPPPRTNTLFPMFEKRRADSQRCTSNWAPLTDRLVFFTTRAFLAPQPAAHSSVQQDLGFSHLAESEEQLAFCIGHVAACIGQLDLDCGLSLPSPARNAGANAKATSTRLKMVLFISA